MRCGRSDTAWSLQMLKKLRRKIILINMILVGIVLLALFSIVCVNTYQQQYDRVDRSLSDALNKPVFDTDSLFGPSRGTQDIFGNDESTSGDSTGENEGKRFVTTSMVSIYSGTNTYITSSNSLNLSRNELDAAVAYVLDKNKRVIFNQNN